MLSRKMVKGMGGAMDLVAGSKRVIVVMTHNNANPSLPSEETPPQETAYFSVDIEELRYVVDILEMHQRGDPSCPSPAP